LRYSSRLSKACLAWRRNARYDPCWGEEAQAIEKFDAVIESTRLASLSLDSIHKMAVETGAGLALASPPNNVLGWPKGLLSEQMESPTNETHPIWTER
jgi:hypothetical protein